MSSPDRVFAARTRTDASPSDHSESTADFLDRVAGPYWDQVRELIEEWTEHLPAAGRADIVGRLRSSDDRQHAGAFWELYLHETFVRSGCSVTIHPTVPGSPRQPDFLIAQGDEAFYVEAKAIVSKATDAGASARKRRVYDALDKIACPNFFLQIDVNRVGEADLPTAALRRKLEAWVARIDPDTWTIEDYESGSGNRFTWAESGWQLEFRPFPVKVEARGRPDHRPLGIFGPIQAAWINDDVTLRSALADKGAAYGALDHPLVIAVNSHAFSHDDFDTLNALYGTEQITISMTDRGAPPVPTRAADGYWLAGTWAHQHVAGVLVGRSITEYRATIAPTFWSHPEPHKPVAPLPIWRVADPLVDHIEYREPQTPVHELFGLPEVWPIGDAFSREVSA